jgi:hypothetical protein
MVPGHATLIAHVKKLMTEIPPKKKLRLGGALPWTPKPIRAVGLKLTLFDAKEREGRHRLLAHVLFRAAGMEQARAIRLRQTRGALLQYRSAKESRFFEKASLQLVAGFAVLEQPPFAYCRGDRCVDEAA